MLITWSKSAPGAGRARARRDRRRLGRQRSAEAVERLQPAGAIYWMMDEADVQRVLRFEHTMIGSDGLPHDIHPHPRLWGTFPRVLGHYCRELGLFGLEEAVRKMTGLSAARFGLAGRGAVAAGRLCRHHRVRPGDRHRPRHLRGADDPGRRHRRTSSSTAARSGPTASPPASARAAPCAARKHARPWVRRARNLPGGAARARS